MAKIVNYFPGAITVLESLMRGTSNTSYETLIFEIAKSNPKALIEAVKKLDPNFHIEDVNPIAWTYHCKLDGMTKSMKVVHRDEILKILKTSSNTSEKVNAIKKYRELSGVGLAEAKHAVEAVMEDRNICFTSPEAYRERNW